MASTGIRFENFFCASPVCSPARASILTGQIPSQHGVQDFLRKGDSTHLPQDGVEIEYMHGRRSYIEILAENGYSCGLSGSGTWTLCAPQLGFDYWNVHASGGGNYYRAPMIEDGAFYQPDGYVTDVITDHALEFLDAQLDSGAPFSLNVHYTAPHAPWSREHHPAEIFDKYHDGCAFDSVPDEPIHRSQAVFLEPGRRDPRRHSREPQAGPQRATSPRSPRWTGTSAGCSTGWKRTDSGRTPSSCSTPTTA